MRPPSAPVASPQQSLVSPSTLSPPTSFISGLGMGSSPVPIGQHLQNQQAGLLPPQVGPRGPLAPVPSNQALLQPLIPTTTGFGGFVPARPANNPSPFQAYPLVAQPTAFAPISNAIAVQPTGFAMTPGFGVLSPTNSFLNASPFAGGVATNPTGFPASAYTPSLFSPPPVPPLPTQPAPNNSPANIFAQMKSGNFANEDQSSAPQTADKYDALRPLPPGMNGPALTAQPTGWGYNAYQGAGYQ